MVENIENVENVTPQKMTIEQLTDCLRQYMHKVYKDVKISMKEFMFMYTILYNFSIRTKEISSAFENPDNPTEPDSRLKSIYDVIQKFLDGHVKEKAEHVPESDQDEVCLDFYCKAWNDFHLSSNVLDSAATYLNKQMSKKEPADATTINVEQLAIATWCKLLFTNLNKKISDAALRMLERSRKDEEINTQAIQAVVQTYIQIGVLRRTDETEMSAHLKVYKDFERRVLEGTKDYYYQKSAEAVEKWVIQEKSFSGYMKHIQHCLDKEMKLAKLLHATTEAGIRKVCVDTLITAHEATFDEEFRQMLQNDRDDDLKQTCALAVLSEQVLQRLNKTFEEHCTRIGFETIEKCAVEAAKDPKMYIDAILTVYNKYNQMVTYHFNNEKGFKAALDKACGTFINKNTVTKMGSDSKKCPELLANYCHLLLRKSKKNLPEDELEYALEQSVVVFRYIDEKDVFEKYYKIRLAERLIEELSASNDAEASMISKMKNLCGYSYTDKLQRMYQDISTSEDLNKKFIQRISTSADQKNISLEVRVLQNGSWPFKLDKPLTVPEQLITSLNRFTQFYNEKHGGRKLMWLHSRSKGDLIMKTTKQRYTVKSNTYQMAILLQFNEKLSYTVQELQATTGMEMAYLKEMLIFLIEKTKLLQSTDSADKLTEMSKIELNENYHGPKLRFDISIRMKSDKTEEQKSTNTSIDQERKYIVEAAIVRVMKMRKTLKHQELIAEVIKQVASRFTPKVNVIKKCIDQLIERDYLERQAGNNDVYNYLA